MHDRPKKIKAEILPYDDCNVNELLETLAALGFINRYEVSGAKYIQVVNFDKHQNPHVKEQASEIPAPCKHSASPVQEQVNNRESTEVAGLIPSSLILDSGLPSNPLPPPPENFPKTSLSVANAPEPEKQITPKAETELQAACRETWHSYAVAYSDRYGTDPVINAKVRSQVKSFVQRIGFEEAPQVAAFYVSHAGAFYVKKSHDFGSLLSGAEGLRTEWATGRMVTVTSAQQSDRTQSNFNAANEALKILESRRATT